MAKNEENLKFNSSKVWKKIFNSIKDSICIIDINGKIQECNISTVNFINKKYDEIIGNHCCEVIHGSSTPIQGCPMIRMKKTYKRETMLLLVGDKWYEVTADPIIDKSKKLIGAVHILNDITEKKEAIEKYRLISENIPVVVYSALPDEKSTNLFVSGKVKELTGYDGEKFIKNPDLFNKILHPDDKEYVWNKIKENREKKIPLDIEYRIITKNNKIKWIKDKATPSYDKNGNLVRIDGYNEDIDENKKFQEKLKHNSHVLSEINDAVISTKNDEKFTITSWNKGAEKIYGWKKKEVIGKSSNIFKGEFQDKDRESGIKDILKNGFYKGEAIHSRKDGKRIVIDANLISIKNNKGEITEWISVNRDITEIKKTEEALKESEIRYRAIVENQSELVCRFLPDGKITYVNQAYCKYFGKNFNELIGNFFYPLIVKEDQIKVKKIISKLSVKNPTVSIEERVIMPDYQIRWQQWINNLILDEKNQIIEIQAVGRDITERKKAEEALKERKKELNGLYSLALLMEKTKNLDMLCNTFINEIAPPSMQFPDKTLTTIQIDGIIYSTGKENKISDFKNYLSAPILVKGQKRGELKIGYVEKLPIIEKFEKALINNYADRFGKFIENREAEKALNVSKEKYHSLFKNAPNFISLIDKNMIIQDINYVVPGLDLNDVIGKKVHYFVDKNYHKIMEKTIKETFKTGEVGYYQSSAIGPYGKKAWYDNYLGPIKSNDEVVAITIIGLDITRRKKAEEALKGSEMKFRFLMEQSSIPIAIYTPDGHLIKGNKALAKLWGISHEQLEDIYEKYNMLEDKQNEKFGIAPLVKKAFEGNLIKIPIIRYDGSQTLQNIETKDTKATIRYIESRFFPIKTSDDKLLQVVLMLNDITDKKKAEEDLKKSIEELKRSNKELENFAYIASHDLQEPLRLLISYSDLLEKRYKSKLDKDGEEFLYYISDSATRMQQLIKDLLSYSRIGTKNYPFEKSDSNEILKQAVKNLDIKIKENQVKITYDGLPMIFANFSQMVQLIQNLIDNSIKFQSKEKPRIHISAEDMGNEWKISVKDNGIGIDKEYFDMIFEIFNRLNPKSKYSGSGIGLAISKKIIELHKGRMWVESKKGKGSLFSFTIPKQGEEYGKSGLRKTI